MRLYEIEVLEESLGYAQKLADALNVVFGVTAIDKIAGPNGNPLLIIEVPDDWHWEASFKLWLIEGPGLSAEVIQKIEPLLVEADEIHSLTETQYDAMRV